jgi:hypothetical protein
MSSKNHNEMSNNKTSELENYEKQMRSCLKAKAFTSLIMNYMYSNSSTLSSFLGWGRGRLHYSITR